MNPDERIIAKTFRFEAAHQLVGSLTHCDHIHGHSYRFEVRLRGRIQRSGPHRGMVVNFSDLSTVVRSRIVERLDHAFISARLTEPVARALSTTGDQVVDNGIQVLDIPTTTAEMLAKWIADQLLTPDLSLPVVGVTFWETETSYAVYEVPTPPAPLEAH